MIRNLLVVLVVALGFEVSLADEKVTVTGEYYAPNAMAPALAKEQAIYRAQVQALQKAYGTVVSETSISLQSEGDGHQRDSYHAFGECDVRGEWIETIGQPEWKIVPGERETYYEVTLSGIIREIPGGRADLDVRLLYNGTDKDKDLLRNATYKVGDYMYIYFKSPVDGYLACYLVDDDEVMTIQCLVPYDGMREGFFPVEAGKEYILFSPADAQESVRPFARRLRLNTRGEVDVNQLYVIFSPNKFLKASDSDDLSKYVSDPRTGAKVSLLPRKTDFKSFHKWLSRLRKHDRDLQIVKSIFSIER